jgi:cytochrome c-type biogenesis protein CcmH/NrfG
MSASDEQTKSWSNTQAYTLSVICLILGVVVGYLMRAPKTPVANVEQAPPAADSMAGSMPTPDQLKHMADMQAEPLLAALQKQPNDAALLAKIGDAYFAAQQFQAAATYYERAAASQPDAKTLTQLASSYYYGGEADKAIAALNRALQLDPKYADALFNLGMIQWRAKNDPQAAIVAWERLLKTNPDHPRRAQIEQAIARAKQHLNIPPGTKTDKPAS